MRVIVTQAADSAPLVTALERRNVEVWHVPVMKTALPEDTANLAEAIADWERFDWVAFTSKRAVAPVVEALRDRTLGRGPKVAAVGPATKSEVERFGWRVEVTAPERTGANLADAIATAGPIEGACVFFPRSEIARDSLPTRLRELGAEVTEAVVYRTVPAVFDAEGVRSAIERGEVAALTFTSPSAARFFAEQVEPNMWADPSNRVLVAAIGPTTEEALRELGVGKVIASEKPGTDELAELVAETLQEIRT